VDGSFDRIGDRGRAAYTEVGQVSAIAMFTVFLKGLKHELVLFISTISHAIKWLSEQRNESDKQFLSLGSSSPINGIKGSPLLNVRRLCW